VRAGESGPETYVYGDIFFHFAAEYDVAEEMPELIMSQEKKATHEIKSINAINQTAQGLCTALMCVLDYILEYRCICY
jgi:hypothetical protein